MELYNKYRPHNFDEIIGQKQIVDSLRAQSVKNHFFGTYIMCGQFGSGKTTSARILAAAINCHDKDNRGNPCGVCSSCRSIFQGNCIDVTEYSASEDTGVEKARWLIDNSKYSPAKLDRKVYIIDEVQSMSGNAWDSLLKLFEEPPEHCVYILCTTDISRVKPTVRSRAAIYSFSRISQEDIYSHVRYVARKEGRSITDDGAKVIAKYSEGSMRNALSLLDITTRSGEATADSVEKSLGNAYKRENFFKLVSCMAGGNVFESAGMAEELCRDSLTEQVHRNLLMTAKDMLLFNISEAQEFDTEETKRLLGIYRVPTDRLLVISKMLMDPVKSEEALVLQVAAIAGEFTGKVANDSLDVIECLQKQMAYLENRVAELEKGTKCRVTAKASPKSDGERNSGRKTDGKKKVMNFLDEQVDLADILGSELSDVQSEADRTATEKAEADKENAETLEKDENRVTDENMETLKFFSKNNALFNACMEGCDVETDGQKVSIRTPFDSIRRILNKFLTLYGEQGYKVQNISTEQTKEK